MERTACVPVGHGGAEGVCSLLFLQEMVDWFNAIRAARFHYLQVAFPGASDEEVRRGGVKARDFTYSLQASNYKVMYTFLCM